MKKSSKSGYLVLFAAWVGMCGASSEIEAKPEMGAKNQSQLVAVVNKASITKKDLEDRIHLLALTSGMKEDDGVRRQVLKSLIEELLQIQAAKEKKVTILEADVTKALEGIAKENGMSLDDMKKMFASKGVPIETLAQRMRAQMYWVKYIRDSHGYLVHVSESEIDRALKLFEENKNQEQYALTEIVFRVDNPSQEKTVRADAERIHNQLRSDANISVIARQFSQAPSAATGGDIGWVTKDYLEAPLRDKVQKMKPGEVSELIRSSSGWHILHLRDIKRAGEGDPGETEVTFCQVIFPLKPDSTEEEAQQITPQIQEAISKRGCQALTKKAQEFGVQSETSKKVKLNQLPEGLKQLLRSSEIGKCAQPAMTTEGVVVTMLCSKDAVSVKAPTRDELSAMLEQEKLSKQAGRELTRLRTTAFIEIKDPSLVSPEFSGAAALPTSSSATALPTSKEDGKEKAKAKT